MRAARQLVEEMQLWSLVWQQVEAFVDRVDGARDQDRDADTRLQALLKAAQVVEQERIKRNEDAPLGDPLIDAPPRPSLTLGWGADHRIWRLPGTDEVELAVAQLFADPALNEPEKDKIEMFEPSDFYDYFVEPTDPAFAHSDNGRVTVRMPAYPGQGTATIAGTAAPITNRSLSSVRLLPDLQGDSDDAISLFSFHRRKSATFDTDHTDEHLLPWSDLVQNRRANRNGADLSEVKYFGATGAEVAWSGGLAAAGQTLVNQVIARTPPAAGTSHLTIARNIAEAARGAVATGSDNADLLRDVADTLDEVGGVASDLSELLRTTADDLHPRPDLFVAIAEAAENLQEFLALALDLPTPASFVTSRNAAAVTLRTAITQLTDIMSGAPGVLLNSPPENGALAQDINNAVAERIAYPDGSLRILRALEMGFVRFWPARIRWFSVRHELTLTRAFTAFRAPFVQGLRALVHGGDTGFPVEGLTLLAAAPTRSVKLRLDHPVSFAFALGVVEAGHIVLTTAGREAAMIVLGVASDQDRLAFDIAPLRVSIAPDPAAGTGDTPGLIAADQSLDTFLPAPGLLTTHLKAGEHPTDPTRDGRIETAVILYSQLALIFGWHTVEADMTTAAPNYANRQLPDPVSTPLETVAFHGGAPANVMTLVLHGMDAPFLDMSTPAEPTPRVARPGEHLLIRGRGKPADDGTPGPMRQAVIAVDSAYVIKAEAFHVMDKSSVALLSTAPLPAEDIDTCLAKCAPEDPLIVITLERTWQNFDLVSNLTLRRDFAGFDLPSLATGRLLPEDVVVQITGQVVPAVALDIERSAEFRAAREYLDTWTRFARR